MNPLKLIELLTRVRHNISRYFIDHTTIKHICTNINIYESEYPIEAQYMYNWIDAALGYDGTYRIWVLRNHGIFMTLEAEIEGRVQWLDWMIKQIEKTGELP